MPIIPGIMAKNPISQTDRIQLRPHYIDTPTARQAVAKHAAEVEVLDQQVRETRELMKEMDLEKDTILIFLSEQGIAMPRGKWSPYEHGSRALCLAYWKGRILPRTTPPSPCIATSYRPWSILLVGKTRFSMESLLWACGWRKR